MPDEPRQIAEQLIAERGADGALAAVRAAIAQAHADGDNYGLSIWREVRQAVRSLTGETGGATSRSPRGAAVEQFRRRGGSSTRN
jgi:hypothetical protein